MAPNGAALWAHVLSLRSGLCGWAPLWLAGSGHDGPRVMGQDHVRRARVEGAALAAVLLAVIILNFEGTT